MILIFCILRKYYREHYQKNQKIIKIPMKQKQMKQRVSNEEQEKNDSDERMRVSGNNIANSGGSSVRCMKALAYKSIRLQKKRYCTNICQITTPLLCVLFTIVVKVLTDQLVSSQIVNLPFPVPMDLPPEKKLINLLNIPRSGNQSQTNTRVPITCKQLYLYEFNGSVLQRNADQFFGRMLKTRCGAQGFEISPVFKNSRNINQEVLELIHKLDSQPLQRGQDIKIDVPDGTIKIHQLQKGKLNATLAINDLRLPEYHRNNGVTKIIMPNKDGETAQISGFLTVTEGAMGLFQKVSRSFLQSIDEKQIIFGNWMYMSFDGKDISLIDKIINIMGSSLYPLGLALLLPLFLYAVVSQKQERLIQIMKMNGLNVRYYWVNFFGFNFLISAITFSAFYIFGRYVLQLSFFTQTSFAVFGLVLLGWAIAQISLTMLVQIFLSDSKSATIVGYLLSTFSTLVGQPLAILVYPFPTPLPWYLIIYPPFTLSRAIGMIGFACSNQSCYSSLQSIDYQLVRCLIVLFSWFFVFLTSIWLNQMIQQDYGVAHRPWIIEVLHRKLCYNFLCQKCYNTKKNNQAQIFENEIEMEMSESTNQQIISGESDTKQIKKPSQKRNSRSNPVKIDESVKIQFEKISAVAINQFPLVSKKISKKYNSFSSADNEYVALKPLTLGLQSKEIFGLLGPNGAGKTTFISVLTGMYPQTQGNAWIQGHQIGYTETNRLIGVCPQFDLLWSDLSVYQHLKFYALLKGVQQGSIQRQINDFIDDFDLNDWRQKPSKELSGGMKRRLSIANSLIGNPSVVFLDEPSSGLDPGHRRQLWEILLKCKKRTCMLLTTHLMQQAEVLCDRVGIIDKGSLLCLGTKQDLKQKFGKGYRLTINFNNHDKISNQLGAIREHPLIKEISQKFNGLIVNELTSRVIFKIQKSTLIGCVSLLKKHHEITWLISQPSLYDVFVDFVQ